MSRIAIIPARGGSRRIPRKNIRDFLGSPIISYPIKTALKSGLFDEVMVSTDDEEIRTVAEEFGARVPFMRSAELSDDHATTTQVLLNVLENYEKKGKSFDLACCIYPTSVFVTEESLKLGFEKITNDHLDSVFSVVAFSYPIWRSFEMDETGAVKLLWPEHRDSRSQDLKRVYHDAGQWYWFRPTAIFREGSLFMKRTGALVLDERNVQDIDDETDWQLAKVKYRLSRT